MAANEPLFFIQGFSEGLDVVAVAMQGDFLGKFCEPYG